MTRDEIQQLTEAIEAREYANFNVDGVIQKVMADYKSPLAPILLAFSRVIAPFIWKDGFYSGFQAATEVSDEIQRNEAVKE